MADVKEISVHQAKLFAFLNARDSWCTSGEAAAGAAIAKRTARLHLSRWASAGIVDTAKLFHGYRYRLSNLAEKRQKDLVSRLRQATEILGL